MAERQQRFGRWQHCSGHDIKRHMQFHANRVGSSQMAETQHKIRLLFTANANNFIIKR